MVVSPCSESDVTGGETPPSQPARTPAFHPREACPCGGTLASRRLAWRRPRRQQQSALDPRRRSADDQQNSEAAMRRFLVTCVVLLSCAAPALAQSITCESSMATTANAAAGSAGKAGLQLELSDNRCIEGTTYGRAWKASSGSIAVAGTVHVSRRQLLTGNRRIVCESQKGTLEWAPPN